MGGTSRNTDEDVHFWRLSTSGSLKSERNGSKQWTVNVVVPIEFLTAVVLGRRIDVRNLTVMASTTQSDRREDMPWTSLYSQLVSGRLMHLWESLYPGNIQYIPCDIKCVDGANISDYFLINPLHVIDCMDEAETRARFGDPMGRAVIDPSKVPENVGMFRVSRTATTFTIRESVRMAMKREKITGWYAYSP